MRLYAHPGASSLHIHILLREIGEPFDLVMLNVTEKRMRDGADYRAIAPRGMVPVLELEDGQRLTENLVIAQFVCDRAGRTDLMPAAGDMARYRVMEWQSYVAAELHKGFIPLRWPLPPEALAFARQRLIGRFDHVAAQLARTPFLMGKAFTAADAYLFVIAGWAAGFCMSMPAEIADFLRRVSERPAVREALAAEAA
jgi:glutathione S-transferase